MSHTYLRQDVVAGVRSGLEQPLGGSFLLVFVVAERVGLDRVDVHAAASGRDGGLHGQCEQCWPTAEWPSMPDAFAASNRF